ARQDVFDDIAMFYNPKRKHRNNGTLPPVDVEAQQQNLNEQASRKLAAHQTFFWPKQDLVDRLMSA
ncbi:MAG: hypothetical protein ACRC6I_04580, partial [Paracoccaceae bacterium]